VTVHIEDARTFLQRCDRRYDVISFGLLDSHTQGSSYNNIRLDHYVYTIEGLQSAKARLKPNGILCLLFMAERDWITQRLYGMLEGVFHKPPLVLSLPSTNGLLGYGGDMFIVGNSESTEQILSRAAPNVASLVKGTEKKLIPGLLSFA
jgi:spermidine synthase